MLLFCLLTAASAKADPSVGGRFTFEGNRYKFIIDRYGQYSVKLVKANFDGSFKGSNFDIPASVTYEGKLYPVTAIGTDAFMYWTGDENITRIYISQNVDTISPTVFTYCPSLSVIRVDTSNPFFSAGDDGILYNKEKTTLIAFPRGSKIGGTFSIPTSVTSIADYAFLSGNLTTIIIPNKVTNIDKYAFSYCSNLQELIVRPSNPSFSTQDGVLFDKYMETLLVYPKGKTGGYEVPYNVTSISDDAFGGCNGLTQISMSDRVSNIGDNAFSHCEALKSIKLPSSLTSIGEGTFTQSGLTSVSIPDRVTSIGEYAFFDCPLKKISLGASLKTIAEGAFNSSVVPDKIYSRNPIPPTCGELNFSDDILNDTLFVPVGSEKAYENASPWYKFRYVVGIDFNNKEVVIGGIKYNLKISDFGERYCSIVGYDDEYGKLGDLTIPDQIKYEGYSYPVTRIEHDAFRECAGLTSVVIPNTVTYVGSSVFFWCKNLKSATFPNTITSLSDGTFSQCNSLSNFTIPNSVKKIGISTFQGCTSLKNITIPASVEQFGYWWFGECNNLEELTCLNTTPPIAGNYGSFSGELYYFSDITYTKATLYVPKESVEAYKTAEIWSNFKKIVGRDFSGISAEQTAGFSVSTDGGKLNITGAKDKAVSVYTIGGAKVYGNNHYTGEEISVARGTYIVKAGAKSLVVTVK